MEGSKRGGIGQPKAGFEVRLLRQFLDQNMPTPVYAVDKWTRATEVVLSSLA